MKKTALGWATVVLLAVGIAALVAMSGCHWVVCGPPGTEVRKESPCR